MKKLKYIIFLSIVFCSCTNSKQEGITQAAEQINDTIITIQFDWTKVVDLKNNTLKELREKEKTNDKIIMDFLNKYVKLVDEFNGILFNLENYDLLNDLFYADENNISVFKNEVEANGFELIFPEGMMEISQNTNFIKTEILPLLDAISIEFLNLYCNEFDNICCDDAAIIISKEELISRILKWGELSKKVTKLEYKKYVEDKFYGGLYLLFCGADNTPAFDWKTDDYETQKYNSEAIDLMKKIITENPTSRAANEFKPFIELLENENFEETQKVKDYLKRKFSHFFDTKD